MKSYRTGALLLLLCGCSNQQIYEGIQHSNQIDCYKLPVAQQEECVDSVRSISYEEYQLQRDKMIKDASN